MTLDQPVQVCVYVYDVIINLLVCVSACMGLSFSIGSVNIYHQF